MSRAGERNSPARLFYFGEELGEGDGDGGRERRLGGDAIRATLRCGAARRIVSRALRPGLTYAAPPALDSPWCGGFACFATSGEGTVLALVRADITAAGGVANSRFFAALRMTATARANTTRNGKWPG